MNSSIDETKTPRRIFRGMIPSRGGLEFFSSKVFFFKIFLLTGLIFLPTGPRTIYAGPLFLQPELYRDENLDGIQLLFAYSMICSVCVCVSSLICLWSVTREMRMTPESQKYDYKDININIMYLQVSELSVYLI